MNSLILSCTTAYDESVQSAVRIAPKQQIQACIQFKSDTLDLVSEVLFGFLETLFLDLGVVVPATPTLASLLRRIARSQCRRAEQALRTLLV